MPLRTKISAGSPDCDLGQTAAWVRLTSRQGKDLTDWFPELTQAGKCLPPSTAIGGGEIVIADEEGRFRVRRPR